MVDDFDGVGAAVGLVLGLVIVGIVALFIRVDMADARAVQSRCAAGEEVVRLASGIRACARVGALGGGGGLP